VADREKRGGQPLRVVPHAGLYQSWYLRASVLLHTRTHGARWTGAIDLDQEPFLRRSDRSRVFLDEVSLSRGSSAALSVGRGASMWGERTVVSSLILLAVAGCTAAQHSQELHSERDRQMTLGIVQKEIHRGLSHALAISFATGRSRSLFRPGLRRRRTRLCPRW